MFAIIALVIQVLFMGNAKPAVIATIPPANSVNALVNEYERGCSCHDCYWTEVYIETADQFTELFNSYSFKRARNGAPMINGRFVKKG